TPIIGGSPAPNIAGPSNFNVTKIFHNPEPPMDKSENSIEFLLSDEEIRTLNIMAETDKAKLIRIACHFRNAICLAERAPGYQLRGRDAHEFPSLKLYVKEMNQDSSIEFLRAVAAKAQIYTKYCAWGWEQIRFESQNNLCKFVGGMPPMPNLQHFSAHTSSGGRKAGGTGRDRLPTAHDDDIIQISDTVSKGGFPQRGKKPTNSR
ncbi:unnamed protein product, partial [Gordionus sp. m RMFG-2023]